MNSKRAVTKKLISHHPNAGCLAQSTKSIGDSWGMYSAGPFPDEKARLPAIRIHLSYLNAMFGKLQRRWAVASGVTEGSGVSFQSLQFKRMRHGHWQARRSPVTRPLGWVGGDRMWHDCHDVVR